MSLPMTNSQPRMFEPPKDFSAKAQHIGQLYLDAPRLWQQEGELVLSVDEKTGILLVPRDAVRSEDGRTRVLVVRDGRAIAVPVELGLVDETRVWGIWADHLGIPRLTFFAMLGSIP